MTDEQETNTDDVGPVDRAATAIRENLPKSLLLSVNPNKKLKSWFLPLSIFLQCRILHHLI